MLPGSLTGPKAKLALAGRFPESLAAPDPMPQTHFIADDFGLNEAVNAAIVRAHREGALTGAGLMPGQPGFAGAVALARENPDLEIGWHVHLCDSQPVTLPAWPWGNSPVRAGFCLGLTAGFRASVRRELVAQWAALQATGLRCGFINGHHHLHLHPFVLGEIRRVVGPEFLGWLRGFDFRLFPDTTTTARLTRLAGRVLERRLAATWAGPRSAAVWGVDRLCRMQAGEIERAIGSEPGKEHEFIFHPRSVVGDADVDALIALRGKR
jgi:hypothetical protein